ncbi:hypothetical protein [Coleofasciculus sp.]
MLSSYQENWDSRDRTVRSWHFSASAAISKLQRIKSNQSSASVTLVP